MNTSQFRPLAWSILSLGLSFGGFAGEASAAVQNATGAGRFGLLPAAEFRLGAGDCPDCAALPQALWYFRNDVVALPKNRANGFSPQLRAQEDVRRWAAATRYQPEGTLPGLVWVGSPQLSEGVLAADGKTLRTNDNEILPFSVTPKIDTNLSYYNADSLRFFAGRQVKVRGQMRDGRFVARTLWPAELAVDGSRLPVKRLEDGETLASLVRADGGGAGMPVVKRLLWSRSGAAVDLGNKPVLAFVLNGAQGDDDEAHGGHFAVATGQFGPRGEWDDWLVNNFYNLDSVSEKGIVAATLPMDAYQGDLNSGQSWYRPTYVLMAVMKHGRSPALYQEAIGRVFSHFYRHDFRYNHATANCAGISLETLRSLGWNIPKEGAGSHLKAIAALPYMAIKDWSVDSGRKAYDYLAAEKTDLYPFVAFEAAGKDLLGRIAAGKAETPFEKMMAEDIEALVYVRLPQFPSSRALGQAPVASLDEYLARTPEDRSQWKIVPVAARPFPVELKDKEAPGEEFLPSDFALAGYAGFFGMLGLGGWRLKRRRQNGREQQGEQAA